MKIAVALWLVVFGLWPLYNGPHFGLMGFIDVFAHVAGALILWAALRDKVTP